MIGLSPCAKILESHGIRVKFESLVLTGTHIASE